MSLEKKTLSSTLNLSQTEFPMKANLVQKEPGILADWEASQLYERRTRLREKATRADTFILHDGPPYANGNIHIGHAVNKILKDIVIRTKFLDGKHTPYVPGWDCHGLPIEINVEKKLGKVGSKNKEGSEVTAKEFRAACRAYAEEWVNIQKAEFQRLGVLADWKHPYKTLDPAIEANIVRALGKIVEKGDIAQGWKPVHWCFDCGSSLAEAEIEYQEKESPSIDVKFAVVGQDEILKKFHPLDVGEGEVSLVIWTTTPWTLPMNRAVALGREIIYSLVQVGDERLIIAKDLVDSAMGRYGIADYKVLGECQGKDLGFPLSQVNQQVEEKGPLTSDVLSKAYVLKHPFMDREVPIILGDHVTADSGTGAVHTAPAHGEEDYRVGQIYRLEMDHYIQDNGTFKLGEGTPSSSSLTGGGLNGVGQQEGELSPLCSERARVESQNLIEKLSFNGLHIWKANPFIVDLLTQNGKRLSHKTMKHSYPHCWRHKTPVIFRATAQFFITMDKSIRAGALEAIKHLKWQPSWGMERMQKMIEGRPDWCVSRQRTWGVPLPFILDKNTKQLANLHTYDKNLITEIADFIQQNGMDAWADLSIEELEEKIPALKRAIETRASTLKTGGNSTHDLEYEKVKGVPDVWFESGLTHDVVLNARYPDYKEPGKDFVQADVYLEGSDQYRGWFQSSLLTSVAINGAAPYKQIITHGFVVDAQGRKMSKSIGNVIAPETIIKKFGVDILRLWVASTDYSAEMVISDEVLLRTADVYRRIRNTARFLLANTVDFDLSCHASEGCHPGKDVSYYLDLDLWALNKTRQYQKKIKGHYDAYDFVSAMQAVQHFCANELGGFYLDVIKDRLYTYAKDSPERRSAQGTLFHILEALVRWIAPVLAFTAEEIWKSMPKDLQPRPQDSVHLTDWYDFNESEKRSEKFDWNTEIIPLRNAVNKQLEIARQAGKIGSPLEAKVSLFVHDAALKATLDQLGDDLRFILIISSVSIEQGSKATIDAVLSEDYKHASIEIQKFDYEKCARCWHRSPGLHSYQEYEGKVCGRCVENISLM